MSALLPRTDPSWAIDADGAPIHGTTDLYMNVVGSRMGKWLGLRGNGFSGTSLSLYVESDRPLRELVAFLELGDDPAVFDQPHWTPCWVDQDGDDGTAFRLTMDGTIEVQFLLHAATERPVLVVLSVKRSRAVLWATAALGRVEEHIAVPPEVHPAQQRLWLQAAAGLDSDVDTLEERAPQLADRVRALALALR